MSTRSLKTVAGLLAVLILVVLAAELHSRSVHPKRSSSSTTTTVPRSKLGSSEGSTTTAPPRHTTSATSRGTVVEKSYRVGDCVMWDQSVANAQPEVVPCQRPHIFQVTGSFKMAGNRFPTAGQWQAVLNLGQCQSYADVWLGGTPSGKYQVASLRPTPQSWADGVRTVWCGVAIPSAPSSSVWLVSSGTAEGAG